MLRVVFAFLLVPCTALVTEHLEDSCDWKLADKIYTMNCTGKGLKELPHLHDVKGGEQIHLYLAHNNLKSVSYPKGYRQKNVTYLDLSHNKMAEFNVSNVSDMASLKTLNLTHNDLKVLSNVTVESLKRIKVVHLNNNKWNCTCGNQTVLRALSKMDERIRCSNGKRVDSVLDFCPLTPTLFMLIVFGVLIAILILCMAIAYFFIPSIKRRI